MYRVSIELYKHEWKFGRTRNAVGTRAAGECFHILGDPGAVSGAGKSLKRAIKIQAKKSQEREEEPLGTMF